jgi:hypothetical protein
MTAEYGRATEVDTPTNPGLIYLRFQNSGHSGWVLVRIPL